MTTEQIISRRAFPITVVLFLMSLVVIFFLLRSNGENRESAALDRETLLKGNAHLKSELRLRDSIVLAIQSDRASDSAEHAQNQGSLKTQIKGLKSRVRQLASVSMLNNANQIVVLQDSVIVADSLLITDLENERDSIRMSYQEEIRILGQSRVALENAYDSTFRDLLSTNDKLIQALKKVDQLTGKNKVLTWTAILEAVGIVILALLL